MPQTAEGDGPHARGSTPVQAAGLVVMLAIPLIVSFFAGQATDPHTDGWYEQADQPPWNPPDWLFGPVWTVLYVSMGVAAWLIWRRRHQHLVRAALIVYFVQLAINGAWAPLFFAAYPSWGSSALWAAFAVIVALIIAVVLTIRAFWPISRIAAALLVPYLAWILYASTLNGYIALAN
ncbi:TspO/MBR family protein [Nesterenkonia populi]